MFQSEQFRQMLANPQALHAMMQMSAMMNQAGGGGSPFGSPFGGSAFGGMGGGGAMSFPIPGVPGSGSNTTNTGTGAASTEGAVGAGTGAGTGTTTIPPPNPFGAPGGGLLSNPALMAQLLGAMGGTPGSPPTGTTSPPPSSPGTNHPNPNPWGMFGNGYTDSTSGYSASRGEVPGPVAAALIYKCLAEYSGLTNDGENVQGAVEYILVEGCQRERN